MRSGLLYSLIIVLVSLVLCVRQLGEPDIWWQVRTGEFILENGYVPNTDVLSYTYAGDPWFNVKWGTEVIMALVTRWFGPESLMLLHWLVLLWILILMYQSYKQLKLLLKEKEQSPGPGFFLALMCFLVAIAYRINARPEMMSHLLTAVYLFLFLHFYNKPGKQILLLIPLQLIWANLHEAFGVGQVLILIFISSLWYRKWFLANKSIHNVKQIRLATLASAIAIASVAIHPMGTDMWLQPFNIFGQLGENKFTTELWSFKQSEFWNLAAYVSLLFLLFLIFRLLRKEGGKFRWQSIPLFYLLVVLAFFYLATSANRNLPFVLIAMVPLLAIELELWLGDSKALRISYFTAGILFYISVASGKFYQKFYPVEKYGLQVDIQSTPIGAAEFIHNNGLSGNAYVDYFSSSYFLWALQPEYKSYLDLRDLDVFESQFITNNLLNYTRPTTPTKSGATLFRFMESLDNFTYVVMENNDKFINFHKYMNGLDDYVLAYADPLSSVYIKINDQNSKLTDQYADLKVDEVFKTYGYIEPNILSRFLSKTLNPWYEPIPTNYRYMDYLIAYKQRYLK